MDFRGLILLAGIIVEGGDLPNQVAASTGYDCYRQAPLSKTLNFPCDKQLVLLYYEEEVNRLVTIVLCQLQVYLKCYLFGFLVKLGRHHIPLACHPMRHCMVQHTWRVLLVVAVEQVLSGFIQYDIMTSLEIKFLKRSGGEG